MKGKAGLKFPTHFFSKEIAESITSAIATDKDHVPIPKNLSVIGPSKYFDTILEQGISKKYEKMKPVFKQYGSGILLVGIQNPFSSAQIESHNQRVDDTTQVFSDIYFYDTSGSSFFRVSGHR